MLPLPAPAALIPMRLLPALIVAVATLQACQPPQRTDSKAVKREMEDRKIKHLTASQITLGANAWGDSLVSHTLHQLARNKNMADCSKNFAAVSDSLYKETGMRVGRINPADTAVFAGSPGKAEQIYAGYAYSLAHGQKVGNNLQPVNDTAFLYTAPVSTGNTTCLGCSNAANSLQSTCIYTVYMPKRQVIRRIDAY